MALSLRAKVDRVMREFISSVFAAIRAAPEIPQRPVDTRHLLAVVLHNALV